MRFSVILHILKEQSWLPSADGFLGNSPNLFIPVDLGFNSHQLALGFQSLYKFPQIFEHC